MTVGLVRNAVTYNLDSSISQVVIPFVGSTNDIITVHVGIHSGSTQVASVADDNTSNAYTCKTSTSAVETVNFSTAGLFNQPISHNRVDGEIWAMKSAGAVTKITVTLTTPARFTVVVQSYTGSNIGVSSSAQQVLVSTPTVGLLTTAANSFVCASFHSDELLNAAASTGTLRATIAGAATGGIDKGISTTVADNTVAGLAVCNVALTPTNTTVISGQTVAVPATYACVALEIKA